MKQRVLITGGAGFIGSHLADELLRCGYRVRALDNLSPQVHGPRRVGTAVLLEALSKKPVERLFVAAASAP